jgi:hypothetical protein
VRRFAFQDAGQLGLQNARGLGARIIAEAGDPVAEHGVDEAFEIGARQAVVVGDGCEAIGAAVGDPPQERPLVEQLRVLAGGMGAQPGIEGELLRRPVLRPLAGGGDKRGFGARLPGIAPGDGAIRA